MLCFVSVAYGSNEKLESLFNKANNLKTPKAYTELAKCYFETANLYDSENPDSATIYRKYIKESIKYYQKAGSTQYHSHYYVLLGISTFMENKLDSAIYFLNLAQKIYQPNPERPKEKIQRSIYTFMTHAYKMQGKHDTAIMYGKKLIELAEIMKDTSTIANYCYTVAATYCDLEDLNTAMPYYKSAGDLAVAIDDYDLAAISYGALGTLLGEQKKFKEALPMAQLGLKYAILNDDLSQQAGRFSSIANIYEKSNDYGQAEKNYREAIRCYKETGEIELYKTECSSLMGVFLKTDQLDSAWVYMNELEAMGEVNLDHYSDSLSMPNSFQDLKTKLLAATMNSSDKGLKLEIIKEQYLKRQAESFRLMIWFISTVAVAIIVVLLLLYNRQRQKTKAEAISRFAQQKQNEYLKLQKNTELRLIKNYIEGLESERNRISKELHDGICNDLLALEMEMKNMTEKDRTLQKQMDLLSKTRENIRNVSHEMMPPQFQYATIDEMLNDYVEHIEVPQNVKISYIQSENTDWSKIPKEIAFETYRIAQEAISNSIKHSKASKIEVRLAQKEGKLIIEIADNGVGFDKNKKYRGAGIYTMTERVKSVAGELIIESNAKGTEIKVSFNCENV